jgi:hypothetical protein
VIHEIKNPFKRFGYYAVAVIFNWYASSWGSYFWLGLLLADLDIVFKYQKYIYARPWLFYFLTITYGAITLLSLSVDTINQVANYSFIDAEHSIHPDQYTGLPIYKANPLEVGEYFIPRLHGLAFAFSLQSLIELSPFFQNIFACKPLRMIFPHIFTIYLFHGLIFWSLGAMVCVFLSSHGISYGVNLFITALCCYSALLFSLPVITPIVELLGKHWTVSIWENAHEIPPPKRDTLFPFTKELLSEQREAILSLSSNGDSSGEKTDQKKHTSSQYSTEKYSMSDKEREIGHKSYFSESIMEIPIDEELNDEKPPSKKRDSDRSSKGLEYLRELEKRQSQKSGTTSTSYSHVSLSSSRESKRESQRSVHTHHLSPFPETQLQPPQSTLQSPSVPMELNSAVTKSSNSTRERESAQSSLHIITHLSYPDPIRPRASTHSSYNLGLGHTEQAGLFAQQNRRASANARNSSQQQQGAEVVAEMMLHSKLSVSEVREMALRQARESRERKRDAELLSVLFKEENEEMEQVKGKGKGKERDANGKGFSEGFGNVYGPESTMGGGMRSSGVSVSAVGGSVLGKRESARADRRSFMVDVTDVEDEDENKF